uniref:Uncharacterized protein n=1 Tax=Cannabis sativa TaxID=3483 RepID=A0A803PIN3_CANSA
MESFSKSKRILRRCYYKDGGCQGAINRRSWAAGDKPFLVKFLFRVLCRRERLLLLCLKRSNLLEKDITVGGRERCEELG